MATGVVLRDETGVADLGGDGRALIVDSVGEATQVVGERVGEDKAVLADATTHRHCAVRDGADGRAAGRDAAMELDQLAADFTATHPSLEGRRLEDPVPDRQ